MIKPAKMTGIESVKCEVCLKEFPKSAARCDETRNYAAYFCSLKCCEEWEAEQINERTREAGEP